MTQTIQDPPAGTLARQNGPAQQIQRAQFRPLDPVGTPNALKSLMESQKNGLGQMLPKHITPERLFKTMLVAANRNPDILKCTQSSILETINRAAELGLDLSGTLGEAYPVPFNNKVKDNGTERWVMQCQLIIGYRGMEKLAWQSGEVESIDAEVVYLNDTFKFKKGTEVLVEWEPCLRGDRGEAIGAYACVKMKSGGKLARFLTTADIEKIRNSSKSANSPAWRNWWDEMARKCALKRTLKDAPLSTEKFTRAMEADADDHLNLTDVLEAATHEPGQSRAQRLEEKLTRRPISEGQTFVADDNAPAAVAAQDAATGETIDRQTGEVTNAVDPEPPRQESKAPELEEPKSFVTHDELVTHLENSAMAMGRDEASIHAGLNLAVPAGKKNKVTPAERRILWRQYVALEGAWAPPK